MIWSDATENMKALLGLLNRMNKVEREREQQ